MGLTRLYTGADGRSHLQDLDPDTRPELTTLHATKGIVFRTTAPGHFHDWHNAPRRQYVITLEGEVEIGLGPFEAIRRSRVRGCLPRNHESGRG